MKFKIKHTPTGTYFDGEDKATSKIKFKSEYGRVYISEENAVKALKTALAKTKRYSLEEFIIEEYEYVLITAHTI